MVKHGSHLGSSASFRARSLRQRRSLPFGQPYRVEALKVGGFQGISAPLCL
jgi:hypothetical protein